MHTAMASTGGGTPCGIISSGKVTGASISTRVLPRCRREEEATAGAGGLRRPLVSIAAMFVAAKLFKRDWRHCTVPVRRRPLFLGAKKALRFGGMHQGGAADRSVNRPSDEPTPCQNSESQKAEGCTDGNENGAFGRVGCLHVRGIADGRDSHHGDEVLRRGCA